MYRAWNVLQYTGISVISRIPYHYHVLAILKPCDNCMYTPVQQSIKMVCRIWFVCLSFVFQIGLDINSTDY